MTAGQETPKTEDRDGRSPEGTLEVQAKEEADEAYSQLEEEAQHGQEGGGCYGWTFPCNECQHVEDDIREERRQEVEELREEYERDRERDRKEYSRPY